MIRLDVNRSADGRLLGFSLSGHAGSGPHGYDLVCAAVSAVSFGAVNAVEALTDVRLQIKQTGQGGYLDCRLTENGSKTDQERAQLIFEAMLISMRTIEQSYSDYLRINDKGGADHA